MKTFDRFTTQKNISLTSLKTTMLNSILKSFVKKIENAEVRKKANREMASTDRSLKMIYQSAKEARRNNIQLQKQYEEELRNEDVLVSQKVSPYHLPS